MISLRLAGRVSIGVLVGLGLATAPVATAAVSAATPHIRAHPRSVMVNTSTTLTGTGFPAHTNVALTECSATQWVVMQNPCVTGNEVSVLTNARGKFTTTMVAKLCPQASALAGPITRRTCYIGEAQPSGVDTISLVGAAKIKVTYP